jgi:hypothetical protein
LWQKHKFCCGGALCSVNEFNTLPITLPKTVPAIPPTIGGRLNVFATVVPNAPNVVGVTRLDKVVLDCCVLASTNITFVEWQKGQLKLIALLLKFWA